MYRLRNKIFHRWRRWAPDNRRIMTIGRACERMVTDARQVRAFDAMTKTCQELFGSRAATLRLLAGSIYDRKVLICAYALMGYNTKVSFGENNSVSLFYDFAYLPSYGWL